MRGPPRAPARLSTDQSRSAGPLTLDRLVDVHTVAAADSAAFASADSVDGGSPVGGKRAMSEGAMPADSATSLATALPRVPGLVCSSRGPRDAAAAAPASWWAGQSSGRWSVAGSAQVRQTWNVKWHPREASAPTGSPSGASSQSRASMSDATTAPQPPAHGVACHAAAVESFASSGAGVGRPPGVRCARPLLRRFEAGVRDGVAIAPATRAGFTGLA